MIEKQNNKLLILTESGEKYIVRLEHIVKTRKNRSYKFCYLYNITKKRKITLNMLTYIDEDEIENMETLDMFILENILNL